MKEINVLLTASFASEDILEKLRSALDSNGITIKNAELRATKSSILQLIQSNTDIDFILMPEYFGQEKVKPEEFEQIQRLLKNDAVIVLLVQDAEYGGDYMRQLIAHGINNALFEKDAAFDKIVSRINEPFSRKDAVSYYGLSVSGVGTPVSQTASNSGTQEAAKYLMSCGGDINDLQNRMAQVSARLSGNDLIETVSLLSDEAIEIIGRMERYALVAEMGAAMKAQRIAKRNAAEQEKKSKGKAGLFGGIKPSTKKTDDEPSQKKKGLFSKKAVEEDDDTVPAFGRIKVKNIAFTSINKGVGCTYSAILCAFALAKEDGKKDVNVAIVELDNQDQHFENFCKMVKNTPNVQGIHNFRFGGVDFFFGMNLSTFEANFKARYDYVIYDYGCVPNEVIEDGVVGCEKVFVIGSAAEYRYGEIAEFVREISPLDLQDSFIYLFSDYDERDIGNVASIIPKNRIDVIPREVDAFNPTPSTRKLFDSYVNGQVDRIKTPKPKSLAEKLTQKPAISANILTLLMAVLLVITAIFFAIMIAKKNSEYKTLKANAELYVTNSKEKIAEKEGRIEVLNKQIEDSYISVAVLKDDVAAGTYITEDMLTTIEFHCDLPEGTFLPAEEIVGKYAACNITKDTPLYDYFVAEYVDEPMPLEEDIQE